MKDTIKKFIEVMSPNSRMRYRSISPEGISLTITEEEALSNKKTNVYFLWGVNETSTRLADKDVWEIHYIRLDIDIKKQAKESFWAILGKEEIYTVIDEIVEKLDSNDNLKDYSYIVYSWWGCHIYYSNTTWVKIDEELTPKVWQLAMKRIYHMYDLAMGEEHLKSDGAVCNTARIMRLPTSINQKYNAECEIYYSSADRQSPLLWWVKVLWLDELNKKHKLSTERAAEIVQMKAQLIASWWALTDIKYEVINKFPAYLIAQLLLPAFPYDGRKNFKDNWKLKWYYYVEDTNSICNWWSEEFWWGSSESCWNNFSLVQHHLSLSKHDTFKYFEDNFNI